jgi:hypothetical protein
VIKRLQKSQIQESNAALSKVPEGDHLLEQESAMVFARLRESPLFRFFSESLLSDENLEVKLKAQSFAELAGAARRQLGKRTQTSQKSIDDEEQGVVESRKNFLLDTDSVGIVNRHMSARSDDSKTLLTSADTQPWYIVSEATASRPPVQRRAFSSDIKIEDVLDWL